MRRSLGCGDSIIVTESQSARDDSPANRGSAERYPAGAACRNDSGAHAGAQGARAGLLLARRSEPLRTSTAVRFPELDRRGTAGVSPSLPAGGVVIALGRWPVP
jgi:hypothetical protein